MLESKTVENINGVITKVNKENYLFEVSYIKEIYIPGERIISIPLTDRSVVGIIDIRDEIYTIISLRHKINPNEEDYGFTENSRVLLLEYRNLKIAFLVDSVIGVKEFPSSAFNSENVIIETDIDWRYIKSVGIVDNQTYILLSIGSLVPAGLAKPRVEITRSTVTARTSAPPVSEPMEEMPIEFEEISRRYEPSPPKESPTIVDEHLSLTPAQKDVLMEVGNIGTGNAVTALSKLIKKRIDIDFTEVNIITFDKLGFQFGGPEKKICGIFSNIEKPSQSTLLQVFDLKPLMHLIASLAGKETKINPDKVQAKSDLDDFAVSTIVELGNIMAGHYASALANLMETKMIPDVPDFTMSEAGMLGQFLTHELKTVSNYIIMIKTDFKVRDLKVSGIFFLIPDLDALQNLFMRLGIEYEHVPKIVVPMFDRTPPKKPSKKVSKKVSKKEKRIDLSKFKLSAPQKDALKEVGNIGSGNAANALAKMLNQRVDINVPSVEIVVIDEFAGKMGKKTEKLFISWSNVVGITRATVLVIFKVPDILNLTKIVVESKEKLDLRKITKLSDLPELFQSAMSEIGHILGSHYTNALGNLLGVKLMTEPPDVIIDTSKNLFPFLKEEIGLLQDLSLVITTNVIIKEQAIEGSFVFIPNVSTLQKLLDALKHFYEV